MFTQLRYRLNVKLKPVVLSCAYGFGNNYMLHSVYFRSLVDLENKSCVRVPLVITLPECELNQLSRWSKKTLQIVCEQLCFTCVQIAMYELGRDYFHVQNETRDERSWNKTSSRKIEKFTSYKMTFNLNSLFEIRLIWHFRLLQFLLEWFHILRLWWQHGKNLFEFSMKILF